MKFPSCRKGLEIRGFAWLNRDLLVLLAALSLMGCNTTTPVEETTFESTFSRLSTTSAPDSIYWTFQGKSGMLAATPGQIEYSLSITVPQAIAKDTIKMVWKTLSIETNRIAAWAGTSHPKLEPISKAPDTIANRLLIQYDSISRADAAHHPWTHQGAQAFYVARLFAGDANYGGYPKNCPVSLDTAVVDSLILSTLVDSKDSVGRHSATWALNWTDEQVKNAYRGWLGTGRLRQGQYDTLYPFDDLPPTTTRKLVFTGTDDSTAILRGGDAIKLEGRFADDSGIVGMAIRILSTPPGDAVSDATSKFVLDTVAFPGTPQKFWDLAGRYSIKTVAASNGLYRLQLIFRDRKGQADTATYNFSVHQPGGSAIDSIAPSITPILPSTRTVTVVDTTRAFLVQFGVSDENLKTVTLDGDPVHPVNGTVEKLVHLVEGQIVTVRISASDSSKNSRKDSVQIFRKVAVPPKLKRIHPVAGIDSVSDTTSTYTFQWQVDGVDVDSVVIDTFGVLLDNQRIAEKTLPLALGGTTRIKIRVVDKLRHVAIDSIDVVRGPSVAPVVSRVALPTGVVTVPDTQSYFTSNWTVSDNNLRTLLVLGQTATMADGKCGATVFLKAADTAKIPVWAQDMLGSIGTDTVKVWRPDPRMPYAADIAAAQRGEAAITLTDYILPNVRFARFETTVGLYDKVMDLVSTETLGKPKTNVNIYDAMLFCNALSKKLGLDTFYVWTSRDAGTGYLAGYAIRSDTVDPGVATKVVRRGFRLPTAVEWDAAATAWSAIHPWGSSEDAAIVAEYAVWKSVEAAMPGTLNPTGAGVFDLAGNIAEWTGTPWGSALDATPWIVRGGAFSENQTQLFGTARVTVNGTVRNSTTGFRFVRIGKE